MVPFKGILFHPILSIFLGVFQTEDQALAFARQKSSDDEKGKKQLEVQQRVLREAIEILGKDMKKIHEAYFPHLNCKEMCSLYYTLPEAADDEEEWRGPTLLRITHVAPQVEDERKEANSDQENKTRGIKRKETAVRAG